jgi:hypothetical protein
MSDSRLQQYSADLIQEVLAKANIESHSLGENNVLLREEAFTDYILELLSDHNEVNGVELTYYEARGLRGAPAAKLNAWSLSGDGATADLFVAHFRGDGEPYEVGVPTIREYFQRAHGFLKRAMDGFHVKTEESSEGFEAMRQLFEAKDSLTTVRLFFLSDGVARSLDIVEEQIPGIEVRYVIWDLDKLSRLRVGDREVIELDFAHDYGGAIPCLRMADPTGEYQTFLAYLSAPALARIYGEHGQRLLERNVRAFLQSKGKVNRGLQKTLKEEPHRFLAYNNGLCCTAAEVRYRDGVIEWVKDFQIVNGGQTTASIYHALKKEKVDVSHVTVQIKLTVLKDPEKVSEIVPLISQYANSQNKVNGADFAANGRFHHVLEQLSRMVWAPAAGGLQRGTHWYYERARGSYADDKARQSTPTRKKAWEQENPTAQKFTKTDLAKYEHAWLGSPHFVCLGAEKNFNKLAELMEENGEPVVDVNYFQHLIAKTILFRTAEKVFSAEGLVGFRSQSVAYAVAWLSEKSGQRIDLNRIWNEQRLSPSLIEAFKQVCHQAHNYISRADGNPGECTKKVAFWEEFRSMNFPITKDWLSELADSAFVAPKTESDALAAEWEKVRVLFLNDNRTMQALEAYTNREWVTKYRREAVASLAALEWNALKKKPGLGVKKLRILVEMLAIAAHDL